MVIYYVPTTTSTNHLAKAFKASPPPFGIMSGHQKQGEGTFGQRWWDAPRCALLTTVVVAPQYLNVQAHWKWNMAICLTVAEVLENYSQVEVQIKWPNDLFIKGKKVGGLLVQNTISKGHIRRCYIGIGINFNNTSFPSTLPNACTILQATGRKISPTGMMPTLCQSLHSLSENIAFRSLPDTRRNYLDRFYQLHQVQDFRHLLSGNELSAKVMGVTAEGLLQLKTVDGVRAFRMKEVEWIF